MNTHESYVSLETAKLLKQAGFDWEVNSRWQDWCTKDWFLNTDLPYYEDTNGKSNNHGFSAPTLAVAQRWLREVKNYEVFVVVKFLANKEYIARVETNTFGCSTDIYKLYEEALEAGIKKCLTLILENKL